jgi:HEAT repeat protein
MIDFLDLVQSLELALKNRQMYTAAHPRAQKAITILNEQMREWLNLSPTLHIAASMGKVFVDGDPVDYKSPHLTALARQFGERQISGIIFRRGLTAGELDPVLSLLALRPAKVEEEGGPGAILARHELSHVRLSQTQYKEVRQGEGGDEDNPSAPATVRTPGALDPAAKAALEALAASLKAAGAEVAQASADAAGPGPGGAGQGRGTGPEPGLGLGPEPGLGLGPSPGLGSGPSPVPGTGPGRGGRSGQPGGTLEAIFQQWLDELTLLPAASMEAGKFSGANLSFLAGSPNALEMGESFPPSRQVEGLRLALLSLPPEQLLSVVAGLGTLPTGHRGLRVAFEALAAESFAKAATALMEGPMPWEFTQDALLSTLRTAPKAQALLIALDRELKTRGAGADLLAHLEELVRRLEWENLSVEEKLRQALEKDKLWSLTLDQRLRFLRQLLDEGRIEAMLQVLERVIAGLGHEDPARRSAAALTLTGVTRWLLAPGLPAAAESLVTQGLTEAFGRESMVNVHRPVTEALGVTVAAMVSRQQPGRTLALMRELSALCARQESKEEWRDAALAGLWDSLAEPARLREVVEMLYSASPETLAGELVPYFDAVGARAAMLLVEVLGDEPDRKRRGRLLDVIRAMGSTALPAVEEGLNSDAWYLVRNALILLAEIGGNRALEQANACLVHPDGRVKRAAVRTMWRVGGPASVPGLLGALPAVDPETQEEVMFGLAQLRATQAVSTLAAFAADRKYIERQRVRAAETIGQIGDPRAVQSLKDLARRRGRIFTSAEPLAVRLAACRSLLALNTSAAIEALSEVVAGEPWHKDRTMLQQVLDSRPRSST